ncbi:hypothetical protein V0R37_05580 [Pollutimonas sp. H1-120]|uniref:hypothetical protein n=1 Tax=Pollutimonas sp. H1-120 TaxID=3148824 RepID=UPI003B51F3BF
MPHTSASPKALLINGLRVPATNTISSINPAPGAINFEIASAGSTQIDQLQMIENGPGNTRSAG